MDKKMQSWFFMRPGFDTFRLDPEKHKRYLFGKRDRRQRDLVLGGLKDAGYSNDGYKAAIYGDYGRGKTHQCHNLIFEIHRQNLNVMPIYIKCSAFSSKEPFETLFRSMVVEFPTDEVNRVAEAYARMVTHNQAPQISEIVHSEDIALVMSKGLTANEKDEVRNCMRWLGGDAKVQMGLISKSLQPSLNDSREFGGVLRGLAHMFSTVDKKVPLYFIDEAERFENVTHTDTYAKWLASLRELTEIVGVGVIFFIGAKTRNNLPTIFVQDEIVRRIGVSNYVEFTNPSREEMEEFLLELLQAFVRKGEMPPAQREVVDKEALDATIPDELKKITHNDDKRLKTYPFEPEAFKEFINQVTAGDLTSKPSEVLLRLQKAAQRAMRYDLRTINAKIVEEIGAEGF